MNKFMRPWIKRLAGMVLCMPLLAGCASPTAKRQAGLNHFFDFDNRPSRIAMDVFGNFDVYIAQFDPAPRLAEVSRLPVTRLHLRCSQEEDLSAVQDMPLRELVLEYCGGIHTLPAFRHARLHAIHIEGTPIRCLDPIKEQPLRSISLIHTDVSSIEALRGMSLTNFVFWGREPDLDIGPLAGMPLRSIRLHSGKYGNMDALRGAPLRDVFVSPSGPEDLSFLAESPVNRLYVNLGRLKDLNALSPLPLTWLRLYATRTEDLSALKGKQLRFLHLHRLPVNDLSPLKGMPLDELYLLDIKASDLTPLRGMLLTTLSLHSKDVNSLDPLAGMPLERLAIPSCSKIDDLSPLKGMFLKELNLAHTAVTDLSPLKGMPIEDFCITGTSVTDLSPLKGMPLRAFRAANTPVEDISALAGMKLNLLDLQMCENIRDLSPLKGMPLEELRFSPRHITNGIEIIRNMPALEVINGVDAESFFRDYDDGFRGDFIRPEGAGGTAHCSGSNDTPTTAGESGARLLPGQ